MSKLKRTISIRLCDCSNCDWTIYMYLIHYRFYFIVVNGYVDVQFHVQGDLSGYTKEFIREVIETVAAILDCKEEDIQLNAVRYSTSFFLSLSIKKVYIRKLLALKEQDRLNLKKLNIDYLKIDKETIHLNRGEGKYMYKI